MHTKFNSYSSIVQAACNDDADKLVVTYSHLVDVTVTPPAAAPIDASMEPYACMPSAMLSFPYEFVRTKLFALNAAWNTNHLTFSSKLGHSPVTAHGGRDEGLKSDAVRKPQATGSGKYLLQRHDGQPGP